MWSTLVSLVSNSSTLGEYFKDRELFFPFLAFTACYKRRHHAACQNFQQVVLGFELKNKKSRSRISLSIPRIVYFQGTRKTASWSEFFYHSEVEELSTIRPAPRCDMPVVRGTITSLKTGETQCKARPGPATNHRDVGLDKIFDIRISSHISQKDP